MTATDLMLEDAFQLFLIQAHSGIGNGDLHSITFVRTLNRYLTTLRRELPGIVGQGVDHEECHGLICLHHISRGMYLKRDTFQVERHPTLGHDIEQLLYTEAFDM